MPNEAKSLIELASVDLTYAQLEIVYADQPSELLERIGFHLSEVSRRLSELIKSVNDAAMGQCRRNVENAESKRPVCDLDY